MQTVIAMTQGVADGLAAGGAVAIVLGAFKLLERVLLKTKETGGFRDEDRAVMIRIGEALASMGGIIAKLADSTNAISGLLNQRDENGRPMCFFPAGMIRLMEQQTRMMERQTDLVARLHEHLVKHETNEENILRDLVSDVRTRSAEMEKHKA